MDREQAKNLVKIYDGIYPEEHLETYLNYYEMDRKQFDSVIDKWANRELFSKSDGFWKPKFNIDWD